MILKKNSSIGFLEYLILISYLSGFYFNSFINSRIANLVLSFLLIANFIYYKRLLHKKVFRIFITFLFLITFPVLLKIFLSKNYIFTANIAGIIDFIGSFFIAYFFLIFIDNKHYLLLRIVKIISYLIILFLSINFFLYGKISSQLYLADNFYITFDNSKLFTLFILLELKKVKFFSVTIFIDTFLSGWRALQLVLSSFIFLKLNTIIKLIIITVFLSIFSVLFSVFYDYISLFNGFDFTSGRIFLWSKVINSFYDANLFEILFGHGIGNFPHFLNNDILSSFSFLDIEIASEYDVELDSRVHPHNLFLDTLFNVGFIGLIIFTSLIIKTLRFFNNHQKIVFITLILGSFFSDMLFITNSAFWFMILSTIIFKKNKI